jgi:uncharacterized protein with HEPN domain
VSVRRWHFRIEHIVKAIEKIRRYTKSCRDATFDGDDQIIDAVIRNFQVIGEAARRVPQEVKAAHPEIPWSRMADMRNVLVHEYDEVDLQIVWATLQNDLPNLVEPLRALLDEPEE